MPRVTVIDGARVVDEVDHAAAAELIREGVVHGHRREELELADVLRATPVPWQRVLPPCSGVLGVPYDECHRPSVVCEALGTKVSRFL